MKNILTWLAFGGLVVIAVVILVLKGQSKTEREYQLENARLQKAIKGLKKTDEPANETSETKPNEITSDEKDK